MPGWLGLTLAGVFALVAGHRGIRKDAPGALMALGMAVMATEMAEPAQGAQLGSVALHGPWWAAAFAAVAVWPLVVRGHGGQVCGGPMSHLVGGLAMIYMCVPAALPQGADPALATSASRLGGHAGHHGSPLAHGGAPAASAVSGAAGPGAAAGPLTGALALAGWALACYFLLATVTALTRRGADGTLAVPRPAVIGEAAMAFGTVIMLVAMT